MNKNDLFGKYELFIEEESDSHPTSPVNIIKYTLIKDGYKLWAMQRCTAPSEKQLEAMSHIDYLQRMELSIIYELFSLFRSNQENAGI